MTTFEKVQKIIASCLRIEESKITIDSHLVDDLGADSLDALDIVTALEAEFNCFIDDEQLMSVHTVKDLVNAIENYQA